MSSILRKFWFLSLMLPAALAGCASVPANGPQQAPPSQMSMTSQIELIMASQLDELMQYYDALRKMPPAEFAREYDKAKQNFAQEKSDMNRARLILFLALPNSSSYDPAGALGLLNEWPKDGKTSSGLRALRHLLAALLTEQQRASNNAADLAQKLKEEQKRVEILQNKVEGIKSMEKNLILRDKP